MMPSCDQTGIFHFHSSTTSGSVCLMSLRILPRVFPRQSARSAILCEMSSDADWPWLAADFFIFSSLEIPEAGWRLKDTCHGSRFSNAPFGLHSRVLRRWVEVERHD